MMLSIARKNAKNALHRLDRCRIEGHLLRSLHPEGQSHVHMRQYCHRGFHGIAVQRILEGLAGSVNSNDSGSRQKVTAMPMDENFSLKRHFDRTATIFYDPVLAKRVVPISSCATGTSPFVETPFCSMLSQVTLNTALRHPFQASLLDGCQRSRDPPQRLGLTAARRYLSTDSHSQYKTSAKIPTPQSAPNHSMFSFSSFDPKALVLGLLETTWNITKVVLTFLMKVPLNAYYYSTHPKERREKIQEIKGHAKKEFDHYWTGSKVLS